MRRSMFAAVVCLIAASPLRGQEVDRSQILEEFDIPTDGDGLLIPVIINNKRFTFLVDTGTSEPVQTRFPTTDHAKASSTLRMPPLHSWQPNCSARRRFASAP
jgi:hypothetical protein